MSGQRGRGRLDETAKALGFMVIFGAALLAALALASLAVPDVADVLHDMLAGIAGELLGAAAELHEIGARTLRELLEAAPGAPAPTPERPPWLEREMLAAGEGASGLV